MISLRQLRARLTVWYVAGFATILLLLGFGLFFVLRRERSAELDRSLALVVAEVSRAARIRMAEGAGLESSLRLALEEIEGPDWSLYLLRGDGTSGSPEANVPPEVLALTGEALREGSALGQFTTSGGSQRWRAYVEPFEGPRGHPFLIGAVADLARIERQDARLVEIFIAVGLAALIPVALSGHYTARLSAAPAVEMLKEFTADAAHELRTPLAVLLARTELALAGNRDGTEYRAVLRDVEQEAKRLNTIVDDLLLLARSDAGRHQPPRELVYLDDLASDAVRAAAVLGRARGVRLTLGRYEEAAVRGDPLLLRRLLMILLDNAVKFTPEGKSVRLDVFVNRGSPTLVVDDEGMGIPPDDLPRVFDRFYRGSATSAHTKGSGLGLAIARYVAEVHGAHITLDSQIGRGTQVTVVFPPPDV